MKFVRTLQWDRKHKKEPVRNEAYNNWNGEYSNGNQSQIRGNRDKVEENTQLKCQNKQTKGLKTIENSLRDLWDNIEYNNIHIIGVSEGEEREKIIMENFSNQVKEIDTQV